MGISTVTSATSQTADPVVERARSTWTAGDFGQIAPSCRNAGLDLIARLAIRPGERVLDVACGTGNLALPAARAGADVTGLDIAPHLLEQARTNAAAEGLSIRFDEGNAEALPYADGSFDTTMSMVGAMFAPRPERVAAELLRVTRSGGRIAMANWTPSGFVGDMFRATSPYLPAPSPLPSPLLWGDPDTVRERFGAGARDIALTRRVATLDFPMPPGAVVEFFRAYYGPTLRAFEAVDPTRRDALRQDLEKLWARANRASDGTTSVDSEYLEVVVTVR